MPNSGPLFALDCTKTRTKTHCWVLGENCSQPVVHSMTTVIPHDYYSITTPSREGSPRALRDGGGGHCAARATGRGGHGRALRGQHNF